MSPNGLKQQVIHSRNQTQMVNINYKAASTILSAKRKVENSSKKQLKRAKKGSQMS